MSSFEIKTKNRIYESLSKASEKRWTGSFTFIQAADTQFGLIDSYINNKIDDEITWSKEIHYLRLVIESINNLSPKPKFFIICGDLVDAFPTSTHMREAQISDLKKELSKVDSSIKLVCVCGNHDVGDIPTAESIEIYKKDFGDDYFSFWQSGCKCIVLNSQMYFNHNEIPELKMEQDKWLDKELTCDENEYKHLIIFQHIPLFLKTHDEPDDIYFNIPNRERKTLIDKFRRAGVKKVFSGHYHKNSGGFYEDLESIVTSAIGAQLGLDKHGYRLVHVNENEITHQYVEVTNEVN